MAQLSRIEYLTELLEKKGYETTPEWIKGVHIETTTGEWGDPSMHISGQLRELSDMVYSDDRNLSIFLGEIAERIDDAHEAWLEECVKRHKL